MADISKIQLPDDSVYDIKDEELRRMINILLGIEEEKNEDSVQ